MKLQAVAPVLVAGSLYTAGQQFSVADDVGYHLLQLGIAAFVSDDVQAAYANRYAFLRADVEADERNPDSETNGYRIKQRGDYKQVYIPSGTTTEQLICAQPCHLKALLPDTTTTGIITLRDSVATGGSNIMAAIATGLTVAGRDYDCTRFEAGLTVQNASAAVGLVVLYREIA